MSVFFCKKFAFFCQKSRFTPSNSVRAVLEIFWSCFQFLSDKRLLLLKILLMQTLYPESSLWTNWPEIRKMTMTSQFSNMTSSSNVFDVALFLLSRLATGPSFMSISSLVLELSQFSFIRDWPEIRKSENTLVWVLPNIWRLGRVMDTKFDANVCNRMLLNAAQFKGNSFCRFWVINGKPTGGQNYPHSPLPSRLGLIVNLWHTCLFL